MSSVNEAEQIEKMRAFFKQYGSWLFGGIFIAVVGYGGWSYWQSNQAATAATHTAQLQQLMQDTVKLDTTTALSGFAGTADKISQQAADSAHAIQAQLVIAQQAYLRQDYAAAEKALAQVANSKSDDAGLVAIAKLRLANAQAAQNKFDDALATLDGITVAEFTASKEERKGDIYVAKNDTTAAKKAYEAAWQALLKREQDSAILRMKLESVGVLVEEPNIPRPIVMPTEAETTAAANTAPTQSTGTEQK
ncbi:MAG: tetratricopeptide repeat protein [Acinetobacter sp.]|nr:tetratricopeptide repeat protein [Acinetobacter sp.]